MEKFFAGELIMCAYLQACGHEYKEICMAPSGKKASLVFEKTPELMADFRKFKDDEIMQKLVERFYTTKRAVIDFRQQNSN